MSQDGSKKREVKVPHIGCNVRFDNHIPYFGQVIVVMLLLLLLPQLAKKALVNDLAPPSGFVSGPVPPCISEPPQIGRHEISVLVLVRGYAPFLYSSLIHSHSSLLPLSFIGLCHNFRLLITYLLDYRKKMRA